MKVIYLFFLLSLTSLALARFSGPVGCGTYRVLGHLYLDTEKGMEFVVNERTKSEYRLKVPARVEILKGLPFVNHMVTAEVQISSPFNGPHGVVSEVLKIERKQSDPLNQDTNSGLNILKQSACR